MKLYYSPGPCSLSPHIVANEAKLPIEFIKVDLATKKTETGDDYNKISSKNYVPTLALDDGSILTEGPIIVQFLADQAKSADLFPQTNSIDRYRVQEMLNYLTSEIHKSFGPLFAKDAGDEVKAYLRGKLKTKLQYLGDELLGAKQFLLGDHFTIADAYAFTLLNWAPHLDIELSPTLKAYQQRVAARPAVQQSLREEGLIK